MGKNDDRQFSPGHLAGKIEALQTLLLAACSELPERAMYEIAGIAQGLHRTAEIDREREDRRDDRADGVWEVAVEFHEAMAARINEVDKGKRVRTIQPADIPEADWIYPEKGW